jgi:hypothetical protein
MIERKPRLKVYGMNTFSRYCGTQRRHIAAVRSQREFADLLGTSLYYVSGYAAETGNRVELGIALSKPHTLFYESGQLYSGLFVEAKP